MDSFAYLKMVLSLILVLGMVLACLWAARRFGFGGMVVRPSSRRRLALVETMPLDAKHRLVLIRRDDREHLLLLGASGDVVIETGFEMPRFELPRPDQEVGR
jgi:flagellar protein FliO/FliZ